MFYTCMFYIYMFYICMFYIYMFYNIFRFSLVFVFILVFLFDHLCEHCLYCPFVNCRNFILLEYLVFEYVLIQGIVCYNDLFLHVYILTSS